MTLQKPSPPLIETIKIKRQKPNVASWVIVGVGVLVVAAILVLIFGGRL